MRDSETIDYKPDGDKDNIELILDEWMNGKVHTIYNRDQLRKRLIRTKDFEYSLSVPPEAITDPEITFIIKVFPSLPDLLKEVEVEE